MTQALTFSELGPNAVELTDDGHLLLHDLSLHAPTTASFLRTQEEGTWPARLERLLEFATQHYQTADASALLDLLGERADRAIERFTVDLTGDFRGKLRADFDANRKEFLQDTKAFGADLHKEIVRYFDPDAPQAIPTLIAHRVGERMRVLEKLLDGGADSPLGRQSEHIIKSLREEIELLRRLVVERQTLADRGIDKGTAYEELLANRLGLIGRAVMGEVERVGTQLGLKRNRAGDVLLSVQGPLTQGYPVSIVFEAKDHDEEKTRFSENEVRRQCDAACANRGAHLAVFVAASPELLPSGRGFGKVDAHYFVAWPRMGDDAALALVVHIALTELVREVLSRTDQSPESILDAKQLVGQTVALLDRFDAIETSQNSAMKNIQKAATGLVDLRTALLGNLSRLDALLVPIGA